MMKKKQLRMIFKEIFKEKNSKIITKDELFKELKKKGFDEREIINLYNLAGKYKIIQSELISEYDKNTDTFKDTITVKYMTPDDWSALEVLEREVEPEEDLRRLLREWDFIPPKERDKMLKDIFRRMREADK